MNVNNISVVPHYRKDWVVRKEKFNRYKIFDHRKYNILLKKREPSGKILFCYDYGDKLIFTKFSFSKIRNSISAKPNLTDFRFVYKNGRFNLYQITHERFNGKYRRRIRNFSNNVYIFENYFHFIFKSRKDIKSIYFKRLNAIVKNFLHRNGVKFKYFKTYSDNISIACYPCLNNFRNCIDNKRNTESRFLLPTIFSKYLRNQDLKIMIKNCFGFDGKKIVRLICERIKKDNRLDVLSLGPILRGLIPLDYFYKIIEESRLPVFVSYEGNRKAWIRKFLKNYNAKRIFKLFMAEDIYTYHFSDSISLYNTHYVHNPMPVLPKKPKVWREIHDVLIPTRLGGRGIPLNTHFDLPIKDEYKEIDGLEIDGFKFEVPKNTNDLENYSNLMSNCIRGYGYLIKDHNYNVLAIYKNNVLTYNMSIINKTIDQFKGKFNENPDTEDVKKIIDILNKRNIIILEGRFLKEYGVTWNENIEIANEPVAVPVQMVF